jgi:hypothetical protein
MTSLTHTCGHIPFPELSPHTNMPHAKITQPKRKKPQQVSRETTSLDRGASTGQETEDEGSDEEHESGKQKRVRWMNEVNDSKSTHTDDGEEDRLDAEQVCIHIVGYELGYNLTRRYAFPYLATSVYFSLAVSSMIAWVTNCSGRLGGVYYDPLKATLYLLDDTTDSTHFDLTRMCK